MLLIVSNYTLISYMKMHYQEMATISTDEFFLDFLKSKYLKPIDERLRGNIEWSSDNILR